uniref:Soluble acetylcholine binding protein n=1 Tax=Tritonia tetraquetra TaxID=2780533 RepID=I1SKH1_9GAST|nr:soluble acetylcholine binding protein [Tritonia tetraquetra]
MAPKSLVLSLFGIFMTVQVHSSEFLSQRLVEYMARESNPDVIPQKSLDTPVKLGLSMTLIDIKDVDQRKNQVEIDAWLAMTWNCGITFDPTEFNNLMNVRLPPSKVWVPDLAVYNGDIDLLGYIGHQNVLLQYDGNALWIPPSKIRASCDLADDKLLTNATCRVKIGSWTYSAHHIYLNDETSVDISSYNQDSKYNVTNVSAKKVARTYSCCPEEYHHILFTFSFVKK